MLTPTRRCARPATRSIARTASAPAKGDGLHRLPPGVQAGRRGRALVMPPPNLKFNHTAHLDKGVAVHALPRRHVEGGAGHPRAAAADATVPVVPRLAHGRRCTRPSRCATCHPRQDRRHLETQYATGDSCPVGDPARRRARARLPHQPQGGGARRRRLLPQLPPPATSARAATTAWSSRSTSTATTTRRAIPSRRGATTRLLRAATARRASASAATSASAWSTCAPARTARSSARRTDASIPTAGQMPRAAGTANHHAWQAQRNLKQCVSCHRQETCLECHARQGRHRRRRQDAGQPAPGRLARLGPLPRAGRAQPAHVPALPRGGRSEPGMQNDQADFYYDIVCPYAYLGSTQMRRAGGAGEVPIALAADAARRRVSRHRSRHRHRATAPMAPTVPRGIRATDPPPGSSCGGS